ncbi:peroxisomal biogenesis factor 19-like [Prorops nasuta]|uniref:peroxisomal biogenesis factor 19-like n=1 Tax=Prorops nasuta TaxID=863751 RepID=UPI0034CD8BA5
MSDDKNIQDEPADSELDELLDSALKDFDKGLKLSQEKKEIVDGGTGSSKEALEATSTDESWTKDFIKHAADQFEKNLQNLMQNENEDLGASFQKMAQTVASAMVDGNSTDGEDPAIDFQSAVARALKDLSETTENLQ